jgi:hypothetical protein
MAPPAKLKYQNVSGVMLARAFSVASHHTTKRIENMNWAMKPIIIQSSSVVGVVVHHLARLIMLMLTKIPLDLVGAYLLARRSCA